MRVFVDGIELADAVSKVGKAMPLKKAIPILEGIKLEASGDNLILTATDLELSIEKRINASVKVEGCAVCNGKFLIDYINKVKDEAIELDATGEDKLIIRFADGYGNINLMAADEYPPFKNVDELLSFKIKQKDFKDMINKVIFCAAQEDTRPVLKGCCIDLSRNCVTAVTSDGYRLAMCKKVIEYSGEEKKIVVPARSLNEVSKLLEDDEDEVSVNIERNHLMVQIKNTKIVTRLIDNEYINYNKIIPAEFTTELTVDKKLLERSLERASLVIKNDKKSIVKLEIKENVLNISAQSDESTTNENIAISLNGKDLQIGFNVKYITDSLRAITDNFVKLKFNTSTSPGIIVPTSQEEDYLYLILPIRIIG
ncbi:MAG TPA: DNA polymerase III subunit beta [Candidatus Faecicola pullistercoris]|nr:DNA polymerase III subunit beta [Candidatus Faecicola pullistercoris]